MRGNDEKKREATGNDNQLVRISYDSNDAAYGLSQFRNPDLSVLGDNRNYSLDSRYKEFGEVKLIDVLGKATTILKSEHGQAGRPIQ